MNDHELIDELRDSMRAYTGETEIPEGFVDQARRTARRRSAHRAAVAAPPLLAATGVATVIATGAGSHRPSPHSGQSASVRGGGQLHDTAYVIGRVRARLADAGQSEVVETVESGGNGNPGTDVTATSWRYTDPQSGVQYTSSTMVSPGGTNIYDQYVVGTPINGGVRYRYTNLDPVQQLYAVSGNVGPAGEAGPGDVTAEVQQIRQELDSGQATLDGTATVEGQSAIRLTFPESRGWTTTLYVNAQTYAPVQSVGHAPADTRDPSAGTDTTTETWLPATAANIANAQLTQVPSGYSQVSQSTLEKDNPAGR